MLLLTKNMRPINEPRPDRLDRGVRSRSLGLPHKVQHAFAIFSSALLLFQVVWTVCLLFFQIVLLLGYLYAHVLTRSLGRRAQSWLHSGLLAASLLSLPILPKDSWKLLAPQHPALHILCVLALTVGLPFFLLSSTTPLLQAWFASPGKDPRVYRFYALSNAASLAALLSFPILFEPNLSTLRQAQIWSLAYPGVATVGGAIAFSRREDTRQDRNRDHQDVSPPNWKTRAIWVALSACSSALLLAITNHVSQNIAAVPLLWVIPLSLYLLSFILCFAGERWYRRTFLLRFLGVAIGGMTYALSSSLAVLPLWLSIPLFYAGLFLCCMFCHGELALRKPHPSRLTSFYFLCSLGSLAGAVFVALLAPRIFSGFYELHVSLAACTLLVIVVHRMDPASPFHQDGSRPAWLIVNALAAVVIISLFVMARAQSADARLMARNFYGVLRVTDEVAPSVGTLKGDKQRPVDEDSRFRRLTNGTISHGLQFLSPARRDQPTSYYSPNSGIGVALTAKAGHGPLRVGVIGLGVGTIAAYGQPGDEYTFYEINPLVVQIAQEDFRFLQDSRAHVSFELGDARLTLERHQSQRFDVLAVDAFSSDSIPVHLITLEAFELYFRHLKPDGLLAVHVSNPSRLRGLFSVAAMRLSDFPRSKRQDVSSRSTILRICGPTRTAACLLC